MTQLPTAARTKDYSGYFLGAILIGIVLIVLALTMAAAQSGTRLNRTFDRSPGVDRRGVSPATFTMTADSDILRPLELFRGGEIEPNAVHSDAPALR